MRRKILVLVCLIPIITCSKSKLENATNDFLPGKRLAKITDDRLIEISGLAASELNPGMLWAHNDSGNSNEVFLVDEQLNVKLVCSLANIKNRDWEDIAVGPGPQAGKTYIYLGDIGDNDSRYSFKYIYRFEEPILNPGEDKRIIKKVDVITFRLADKKKDCETLMIDPATRNLYVVSKREQPVHVYEIPFPQSTTDTLQANSIVTLPLTQIVAGDFSADGKKILMKNYFQVYYWDNSAGKPLAELLKEKPFQVPYEVEPQGESIAWARDGSGFYTLSEKNPGKESYLYFYQRK